MKVQTWDEEAAVRGPKGPLGRLRLHLEVVGMRLLYRLVPLLPRETVVALGKAMGRWGFVLARRDRRVALANLDLAYGSTLSAREKRRIARLSFENFGLVGLELFWSERLLDPKTLARIIEIPEDDVERGRRLLDRGCGAIALASHLGSWEIMNFHAATTKIPMGTLARRLRNEPLNELVNANRKRLGSDVVLHDDAARGILRALKRNRFIAIPLDQNTRPDRGGVYVRFFGKPVAASRAVALFSLRTGAPIIPTLCLPLRGGRWQLSWGEPFESPREGTLDEKERALTQACVSYIEKKVRERPGAWLWMYRRWKYRPTEDATGFPFYSKHVAETAAAPARVPQESRA
ncbi:lysophospholipid acyltransferase family protein [bacterium]|nr:lysophospholipid acyltransferase family protein [bacterium]